MSRRRYEILALITIDEQEWDNAGYTDEVSEESVAEWVSNIAYAGSRHQETEVVKVTEVARTRDNTV